MNYTFLKTTGNGPGKQMLRLTRWIVRLIFLSAAIFFAIGGPVPSILARALPALSPLAAGAASIAQKHFYLTLFWALPPLAVLAMAIWRGRWFCRWVCPAGTIYSIPAPSSIRRKVLTRRYNAFIFWAIIFSSLAGFSILFFLDPLATFNRLTPFLKGAGTAASVIPGLLVPLFLLIGMLQSMAWCTHLCPLGYLFEFTHSVTRRPRRTFDSTRRSIVAGLLVGVPGALIIRNFAKTSFNKILPPGAGDIKRFNAICTRCYACVNACPARIIQVSTHVASPPHEWFSPEVKLFEDAKHPFHGFCPEFCRECSRVCPTGAIRQLSESEKRRTQIGIAVVNRSACLAWADDQYCMVCQEYCPYVAIAIVEKENGIPCPVVKPDVRRGCGVCQTKCPAVRAGKAIIVQPIPSQKMASV